MDRRAPVPEEFHLVPFIDEQPEGEHGTGGSRKLQARPLTADKRGP